MPLNLSPEIFQRKIGPLPVWGWGIAAGGALIVLRLRSGSSSTTGQTLVPVTGTGNGGGGTGGGTPDPLIPPVHEPLPPVIDPGADHSPSPGYRIPPVPSPKGGWGHRGHHSLSLDDPHTQRGPLYAANNDYPTVSYQDIAAIGLAPIDRTPQGKRHILMRPIPDTNVTVALVPKAPPTRGWRPSGRPYFRH